MRSGIRVSLMPGVARMYRQGRYGPPVCAVDVPMARGEAEANIAAMRVAVDDMLSRPMKVEGGKPAGGSLSDPQMQQRYPTLWMYLTQTSYPDGGPREPSSLLVFMQDGALKAMCRDKDGDRCLWVAARSLVGLLDGLNEQLGDPEADWRPDRRVAGQPAPRGKRAG